MSKRRLERDVEALSDDLLESLTPLERLQLVLEANAKENERWVDRLLETCPQYAYRATDVRFIAGAHTAEMVARQGVYELHTFLLEYERLDTAHWAWLLLDWERDADSTDGSVERVAAFAEAKHGVFAVLYVVYHSHRQLAAAELGVDLRDWFALHPDGPALLDRVEELLDDQTQRALAEEWLAEHRTEPPTDEGHLADLADQFADALTAVWAEHLETHTV